jgi:very-short-patch-repair endonuclease
VATVDFAWPPWRLVLEYDGDAFHGPRRWGLDARRQAAIEALGWRVERADRFDLRPSSTRLFRLLTAILTEPACA